MRKIKIPFKPNEVSDELAVEPGYHLAEVIRIEPRHVEEDGKTRIISPHDEETQVDKIVIVSQVKEGSSEGLFVNDWINLTDGHPNPKDNVGLRDKQRLKSFFSSVGLDGDELDPTQVVGSEVCIEVFHRGTGSFKAKVRKYFPPEEYKTMTEELVEETPEEEPEESSEVSNTETEEEVEF